MLDISKGKKEIKPKFLILKRKATFFLSINQKSNLKSVIVRGPTRVSHKNFHFFFNLQYKKFHWYKMRKYNQL